MNSQQRQLTLVENGFSFTSWYYYHRITLSYDLEDYQKDLPVRKIQELFAPDITCLTSIIKKIWGHSFKSECCKSICANGDITFKVIFTLSITPQNRKKEELEEILKAFEQHFS